MAENSLRSKVWWGKFTIDEDKAGLWRIGSACIRIERSINEWVVACTEGLESGSNEVSVEIPIERQGRFETDWKASRFAVGRTDGKITITPATADRPVVIRTEVPFHLLPRTDVSFYVSSPLWFKIEVGSPASALQDFPVLRPSDTWFGPSPKEGEYCYANRVYGQLRLDNINFKPHRAVTVVSLRNRSADSILIERLKLPAPNLSLYEGDPGGLWTQAMVLEIGPDKALNLQLRDRAPSEIKNPRLIAGPRQKMEKGVLTRALSYLIS